MIDSLEVSLMMKEVLTEFVHVSPNDVPRFLKEEMLNPSGPGVLSVGRSRMTSSISLEEKGRHKTQDWGVSRLNPEDQIAWSPPQRSPTSF
jgi:hypothetical protein